LLKVSYFNVAFLKVPILLLALLIEIGIGKIVARTSIPKPKGFISSSCEISIPNCAAVSATEIAVLTAIAAFKLKPPVA
jgi:hypothetical protein